MNEKIINYIFLTIILFLLVFLIKTNTENDRYTVINGKYGVILLDKKLGFTWRQISLKNDEPPGYWEEMLFYGDLKNNVCKGKEKLHRELQKKLLKDEK